MVVYDKFCQLFKAARLKASFQTYHGSKQLAINYQKSKAKLYGHLEASGYGKWVGKPVEQDTFGWRDMASFTKDNFIVCL